MRMKIKSLAETLVSLLLDDVTTGQSFPQYDENKMRRIIASDQAIGCAFYSLKRKGIDDDTALRQLFTSSVIPNEATWPAYNGIYQTGDTPIARASSMGAEPEEVRSASTNYGAGATQGLLT